ncbi:MAG: response regulator [bacterium]|nr:response regulator [bacterium]
MSNKILIIDDDRPILEAITVILEEEGYDVRGSIQGDTIYSLTSPLPDLILLDIWLSGHNGGDLLAFLKSKELLKDIPVVIISANRNLPEIAKDSGATTYIEKPFDIDKLLAVVKSLL